VLVHGLFSPATPFYITAILPLLTFMLIALWFKETYSGNKAIKLNLFSCMQNIYLVFKIQKTRLPIFILGVFLVGYYAFFNYLSAYSLEAYHLGTFSESVLLTYFAVFFAISLLFIIPYFTARISLEKQLLLSIIPQPFLIALAILIRDQWLFWVVVALMAVVVPSVYVVLLSILSNQTEAEYQGRIMGVSSSINSLAWFIAPLVSALLQPSSIIMPFVFSAAALLLGLSISWKYCGNELNGSAENI
jgi:predicted MFS family arabinose efflux permease